MLGCFEREKRAHRSRAWLAKMTGWLAQANPSKAPSVRKLAGESDPRPRAMSDAEIAASMNAWVAVTKGP